MGYVANGWWYTYLLKAFTEGNTEYTESILNILKVFTEGIAWNSINCSGLHDAHPEPGTTDAYWNGGQG